MKTNRLLRVLCLLSFLLLIAPFYDSCNERGMKHADPNAEATKDSTAVEKDSIVINSTQIANTEVDTINNSVEKHKQSFFDTTYEFIDDDDSENAFEFAELSIGCFSEFNLKDFKEGVKKKDGYKGVFFQLKNFCFILIIITTFLMFIFSLKNTKWIHKLSRLNLILLLITVICLFLEGLFETITQIKWGYYAFLIINLLIFYYSKPYKTQT